MSSLTDDIKKTFDLAAKRLQAAEHLGADDWKTFEKIKQGYDKQRRFVKRVYELEFEERLAKAQRRLIHEAGRKNLNLVHKWFGRDGFDKSAITRQAYRDVRNAHHQDLLRIDAQETADISRLLEQSEGSREARRKPLRDFRRSTDRRSHERRVRKRA